jgi:alkaline phosphatase D
LNPINVCRVAWILSIGLIPFFSRATLAGQIATSDFSVDDEGWTVSGDATSAVPTYVAVGGNPGGYVHVTDLAANGVWYWEAPAKFLGDKLASYGFSLTYQLRMRGSGSLFDSNDLILNGGGVSLHLDQTPPVPSDVLWTSYTALLSEFGGWKVGSLAGPAATQFQFQTVLSSLTRLRIRGEFITGPDNGDLDNVVLHGVPEPSFWLILLSALYGYHLIVRSNGLQG